MSIALMVKVESLVQRLDALEKRVAGSAHGGADGAASDALAELAKLRDLIETRLIALEEHAKALGAKLKIEF